MSCTWPVLIMLLVCSTALSATDPWAQVATPSAGGSEAIGKDTAGCLQGGRTLPADGQGYHLMKLSRRRFYGHPTLVRFVRRLGQELTARYGVAMLVGDLAQARGGPSPSMHRSHQTGLDVDIWFWLPPDANHGTLSQDERERWSAPSMLAPGGQSLNRQVWTPTQIEMLRLAAASSEVDRIFVHPLIKKELCDDAKRDGLGDKAWLHKLRPWWGHDDHFHVRLRCPRGDKLCVAQEPVPKGDGCDGSLDWWFSDEAREMARQVAQRGPPALPKLPAACTGVLTASDGRHWQADSGHVFTPTRFAKHSGAVP